MPINYNKDDLVKFLAKKNNISQAKAKEMIEMVLDSIRECFAQPNFSRLKLPQLGTFLVRTIGQRTIYVPNTRKIVQTPCYKQINFRSAKNLKEQVNKMAQMISNQEISRNLN